MAGAGSTGAILAGADIVDAWRPRSAGVRLRLLVGLRGGTDPPATLEEQAERLAAHRGQHFAGWSAD